jgi:hypothetical protein
VPTQQTSAGRVHAASLALEANVDASALRAEDNGDCKPEKEEAEEEEALDGSDEQTKALVAASTVTPKTWAVAEIAAPLK